MEVLAVRRRRRLILFLSFGTGIDVVVLWLAVALREFLLPVSVGAFTAYACLPLLAWLRLRGVPAAVAKLTLFAGFVLTWFIIIVQLQSILADESALPRFKARLGQELN